MNYRHGFHAGNFADVVKHAALARVLTHQTRKDAALRVIDTHAGPGMTDLAGEAARRTGEADGGFRRLAASALDEALRALLAPYLDAVARCRLVHGPDAYPGSPELARQLTRAQDRLVFVEKHPAEAARLADLTRGDRRVKVLPEDGWTALSSQTPAPERRGVVLIDPPFEEPGEFRRMIKAAAKAWRKWRTGVFMLWYPIKNPAEIERFAAELAASGIEKILRMELFIRAPTDPGLLNGCGLMIVNPPYPLASEAPVLMAGLARHLGVSGGASGECQWLVPETAPGSAQA